jgi:hypothetical protein
MNSISEKQPLTQRSKEACMRFVGLASEYMTHLPHLRVVTNPERRRQARCREIFGCGTRSSF